MRSFRPRTSTRLAILAALAVTGTSLAQDPPRFENPKLHKGGSALVTQDLTQGATPTALAQALAGQGVTVQNVVYTGADIAAGFFEGGAGIIGFDSGVILSSGNIGDVAGPNESASTGTSNGLPGDADLDAQIQGTTFDAAVLEFDLVPATNSLFIEFVFASEEYNEFVNRTVNDAFALFVNGVNCATLDGSTPVAINNVNNGNPNDAEPMPSNPDLYIDNDPINPTGPIANLDTEMDGLTRPLTCNTTVMAGVPNQIKLVVADTGDSIYDSNVFVSASSIGTIDDELDLMPSVAVNPGDRFGSCIATSGNLVAVCKPGSNGTALVEVSRITGGVPVVDEVFEFQLPPGASGLSIFLRGNQLFIGLPGGGTLMAKDGKGIADLRAALFQRVAQGWSLRKQLASPSGNPDDEFGAAVSMNDDGSALVVGAPGDDNGEGTAYVFETDGDDFKAVKPPNPNAGGRFGSAVAATRGRVAVGMPGSMINNQSAGAVHVFNQVSSNLTDVSLQGSVNGSQPANGDGFGMSIALTNNGMMVGSPGEDGTGTDQGAAYLFDPDSLVQRRRVQPNNPQNNSRFGEAVGLGANGMAVGAPGLQAGAGGVYRFSNSFQQTEVVNASGAEREFGAALSLSETALAVGAPGTGSSAGSALVKRPPGLVFGSSFE